MSKMNGFSVAAAAGLVVIGLGAPLGGAAMAAGVTSLAAPTVETASSYWTAEKYKNAKPLLPVVRGTLGAAQAPAFAVEPSAPVPGGLPTVAADPSARQVLFTPKATLADAGDGATPALVGTAGYPFTVNRLYPVADTYKAYPYSLVGQLFFTIPGRGNFVCTASVIRKRVLATAGHCVSDGHGNFYSNWSFVPALSNGVAPYGTWTWSSITVTNNWHRGGGGVPNIQDNAIIVLRDKAFGNTVRRLGDLVGYFGYEYNAARPTNITQLGYPCNLDSCRAPIADNAYLFGGPSNNFEWGTAEFGGASGGPEVQDFGQAPSGTPARILGGNIVVSSTSYTYNNTAIMVDGGSIFGAPRQFANGTFGDLITIACSGAGNC